MSNPTTITFPSGQPTMTTEREFDAPVVDVFRAHIDPSLYVQWIGVMGETTMDEFDPQPGGRYQWTQRGDGYDFSFRGVFHTVESNQLLIQTFEYSGAPGVAGISAATFTDLGGGRTRLTVNDTYPSTEARDAAAASGMEEGMRECYAALERLLKGADVSSAG